MSVMGNDVLQLFEQLYQAEQQLAINLERERRAKLEHEAAATDARDAEQTVVRLRERMQQLARKAAGVAEPVHEDDQVKRTMTDGYRAINGKKYF